MGWGLWLLFWPLGALASGIELDPEAVALAAIETQPLPPPDFPPKARFLAVVLDPLPRLVKQNTLKGLRARTTLLRQEKRHLERYLAKLTRLGRSVAERRRLELEREILNLEREIEALARRKASLEQELCHRYGSTYLPENILLLQVAIREPRPLWLERKIPLTPLAPARYRHPALPIPGYLYTTSTTEALPVETPLWVYSRGTPKAHPLPREAVLFYGGQRWIFRREAPGRFYLQAVDVVQEERGRVWVRAPLAGSGEVVVRGALFLLGELKKGMIPAEEEE